MYNVATNTIPNTKIRPITIKAAQTSLVSRFSTDFRASRPKDTTAVIKTAATVDNTVITLAVLCIAALYTMHSIYGMVRQLQQRQNNVYTWIWLFLFIVVMLCGLVILYVHRVLKRLESASATTAPIVLTCPPCPPPMQCSTVTDAVVTRDRAVVNDPLYPPLNRQVRMPREQEDTFRLLGYVVNPTDKEDAWKLFGREKRRHVGEFYVSPANKNVDVKITLTNDMISSPTKLRDLYDIPSEIRINHAMFQQDVSYNIIVNPQAELGSSAIYT